MLTTKVTDNIEFAYQDSGAPVANQEYETLIILHGHTFHSGTFWKLSLAAKRTLRIILPNRQLYPGSTSYTEDESRILNEGTYDARSKVLDKQGEYLAIFVSNMIQKHNLRKVAVIGWSLGTGFLNMLVESILRLDEHHKETLRKYVCSIIYWDPPFPVHGIFGPPKWGWIPLHDMTLAPEERISTFVGWLCNYYPHPNLASRDPSQLIDRLIENVKTPTFTGVTPRELANMIDTTTNEKGESAVGGAMEEDRMNNVLRDRMKRALFNPEVREAWAGASFWCIYGDQSPWNVIWGVWQLEELSKSTNLPLRFKAMKGANHFVMYDNPEQVIETIKFCLAGGSRCQARL